MRLYKQKEKYTKERTYYETGIHHRACHCAAAVRLRQRTGAAGQCRSAVDALRKTLDDEQLLKKLPEEYPEWVQKADGWEEALDTYESEYLPLSEALDLEYALRDAKAFAAQGVQAEVMAAKSIDSGRESWAYTCIVTAAPKEFLALSDKMDGLYHVWIPGEQFLLRFNIHIWSEE